MRTEARFPGTDSAAGHYESFYIKASRPGGGQAIWIRHTIHKRPGAAPTGSVWVTLFDRDTDGPLASKVTVGEAEVAAPPGLYIEVAGARLGPGSAVGSLGGGAPVVPIGWDLAFTDRAEAFRHLPSEFMYRARLPRTKLLSPHPDALFTGEIVAGDRTISLVDWPGMVGHNWGVEHAERWSWIQANEFREGSGWFDAGLGRIRLGPMTTPWIANAVLCIDGERHRLGGIDRVRSTHVREQPTSCGFELAGRGIEVRGRVGAPARDFVGWRYADPVGPEHQVVNCSICNLELLVIRDGSPMRRLECAGAAAYELGMRESDHGIPLQPYEDG